MKIARVASPASAASPNVWPFWRWSFLSRRLAPLLVLLLLAGAVRAQDAAVADLRQLRAEAIRAAVATVADSVVRVELVGVAQSAGGEVADDAPTVAVAVDDERHFIASSLVVRGDPTSILLVTADERRVVAEVVSRDHARQLVLLRASEAVDVPPLPLAEHQPVVGQSVIAVGRHSGGPTPAVSTGILSATGRNWGLALQTDARVSAGFYGAPLIDLHGRVLGIIVPMVPDGGAEDETGWYDSGIAFAIPAGDIASRLPTLIEGTDIQPGLLGIVARESDPYVESTQIAAVRPRSPAVRAELAAGDLVLAVDGTEVRSHREIRQLLGSRDAGSRVTLRIQRGEQRLEKTLELAATIAPLVPQQLGITVQQAATDADAADANAAEGPTLAITGVVAGSSADGQLAAGDRIVAVDDAAVADVASLRRRVLAADPQQPLRLSILRDGESLEKSIQTGAIELPKADSLPDSLRSPATADERWETTEFDLPDLANAAAVVAPAEKRANEAADEAADDDESAAPLGLLVLVAAPGQSDLQELLAPWAEPARAAGVVVCAIAPADPQRWTPEELDVPQRLAAALRQAWPIDPASQGIAGAAGPGGSLAIASALLKPGTFSGLQVSPQVRPPAIRLRENDPAAPLQWWIPPLENGEAGPSWANTLQGLGYPVLRGDGTPEAILLWVRTLAQI